MLELLGFIGAICMEKLLSHNPKIDNAEIRIFW